MLSFVIMAGCATETKRYQVYKCEQPELKGPTWADVAILSVDQKAAIDICNILNGTSDYDPYEKK